MKYDASLKKTLFYILLLCSPILYATTIEKISTLDFVQKFPNVTLLHSSGKIHFDFGKHPLSDIPQPYTIETAGFFLDSFILTIPQGTVQLGSSEYYPFVNGYFISEMQLRFEKPELYNDLKNISAPQETININGRVAVITNIWAFCYYHWINDVVSKLALLELHGIEYDYLYIPQYKPFMKETLNLWGIDPNKIIPATLNMQIQATEIIIPTNISSISSNIILGCYMQNTILHHIRTKLLSNIPTLSNHKFSQKVYISRKDAGNKRQVFNEDEIFELLQTKGFQRYCLSNMSVADQIALYHHATDIISVHGAGLTNIIFCKPQTRIIEIFQTHYDVMYWALSQMLDLNYQYINAIDGNVLFNPLHQGTSISLDLIRKTI